LETGSEYQIFKLILSACRLSVLIRRFLF